MINCTFENGNKANLRHVVVDAIAIKGDQILIVKRGPKFSNPNKFALPGGFLDRNETTERAVLRELKEETGYEGKITKLFKVLDNPNRKNEDRQNVSFIYQVEVGDKITNHDDEIESVHWFHFDNLPDEKEFAFDHFEIIKDFLAENRP